MKINFDSIKKYYEKRDNEVKEAIKRAKKAGMHPTFIKLLETQGKINVKHKLPLVLHDGATEEQLVKFEEAIGSPLPSSYREFLKFTDGADLGEAGVELFGLNYGEHKNYILYTINNTRKIYNISGAHEQNLLIIGEDITGVLICINIATGEIVGWEARYADEEAFLISPDFHTFLHELTVFMENENSLITDDEYKRIWLVARKTIKQAWKNEIERASRGSQTRDWTDEEFELLLKGERVPGYEGHYMKSPLEYPQYADSPENIQFLKLEREDKSSSDNVIDWYENKAKELKEQIKKAREVGMHPEFISLLEACDKASRSSKLPNVFYKGATEDELVNFERDLGISIPAPYRELLKFTDGAFLGNAMVEFFGINDNEEKLSIFPASYRKVLKYNDGSDSDEKITALFGENEDCEKIHTLYSVNHAEKTGNIIGSFKNDLLIIGKDIADILVCINTKTGEIVGWDYRDGENGYFWLNTDLYTYFKEDLTDSMNEEIS